jgi:DUF1365 family protein
VTAAADITETSTTGLVVVPALYDVSISHRRRDPIDYGFTQRSSMWLVDLDELPALPRRLAALARFSSRDHLGSAGKSLRANLDQFLTEHNVTRPDRILMLANPRVLGYVFNPLSVFYCLDATGNVTHVVAEVRNTYGGRHSYLMQPDPLGRAATDKLFYVSPFYPVDGDYTMRLPLPGDALLVNVTLHRDGERPFAAVMTGHRRNGRRPTSLWSALRTPLATRAVMFGIKRHGIRLYTKGLRPYARPAEDTARPSRSDGERSPREKSQ